MQPTNNFNELGLEPTLLSGISELGYHSPTLVQKHSIPSLIKGQDLLVQAQTGTGKTAAFTLPILSELNLKKMMPQALIIVPTRELAVQVAESCKKYAKPLKKFRVIPIYGGQSYHIQLKALKQGVQVIVGTPGRLMDHFRRGVISIESLKTVILDEADEMLNMGFIKDIKWILNQIPHRHQIALFSATMPDAIKKIAKDYLKDAKKIHIKPDKETTNNIEQYFINIPNNEKLRTLIHFLATEDIQSAIVFVNTKNASSEIAEKLQSYGYTAAALNGDIKQSIRKKILDQMKNGSLDIIVATDLAARGIDVARISHVINFDLAHAKESYTHRIGRTGRAGRKGKALSFVTSKDHRLFNDIKATSHGSITQFKVPSLKEVKENNLRRFSQKITDIIQDNKELSPYYKIIDLITHENKCSLKDAAAALIYLNQQINPALENMNTDYEHGKNKKNYVHENFKAKKTTNFKKKRFSSKKTTNFSRGKRNHK